MTAKTKGRLLAGLIFTIVVAITLFAVVLRDAPRGPGAPDAAADSGALMPPPPPSSTIASSTEDHRVQNLVSMTTEGVWTRVNAESGALEYRMTWEKLDPLEAGVFRVVRPKAWIYRSGATIEVLASEGRLVWPSREREPESGSLQGDVRISAVEPTAPADAPRLLELRVPSLTFHTTLGELQTPQTVAITARGLTGSIRGLTARLSEERSRPLSYLRIENGGTLNFNPDDPAANTSHQRTSDSTAQSSSPPSSTTTDEAYYRAAFSGPLTLTSSGYTLTGQEAAGFARLVNGALRPTAIATLSTQRDNSRSTAAPSPSAESATAQPRTSSLNWSGPLEIRLASAAPAELAADDLLFRLKGSPLRPVEFHDPASGASVRCATLAYGGTRRFISLSGAASEPATLELPRIARITAPQLDLDLTTGIGAIVGAGQLVALSETSPDPSARAREVCWQDRCDFKLDATAGPVGSTGSISPKEVLLLGRAEAWDGGTTIAGDSIRALFDPARSTAESPALSRVIVTGDALARAGSDTAEGSLSADRIEVALAPVGDNHAPAPTLVEATGRAVARREGQSLSADLIEAHLTTDASGRPSVTSVEARTAVVARLARTSSEPGATPTLVEARADRLTADPVNQTADLIGEPAVITQVHAAQSASVSGGSMRLEGTSGARKLTVFGAGEGRYLPAPDASAPDRGYSSLSVTWHSGMVYDDVAGRAEIMGAAEAVASAGSRERHVGRGERILVDITPSPEGDARASSADRILLAATIEGRSTEEPAEVELRKYAQQDDPAAEPTLESMAFVRGPAVELDAVREQVRVPGAGLLLLEDRRARAESSNAESSSVAQGSFRGTSVFTWDRALTLDRCTGAGELTGAVRLRHRPLAGGEPADLDCDQLAITVEGAAHGATGAPMRLTRAEGRGSVIVRQGPLEVRSDLLAYEAATGRATASASEGGRVSLRDDKKGQNISARSIAIDLTDGTWKATGASTITVPR